MRYLQGHHRLFRRYIVLLLAGILLLPGADVRAQSAETQTYTVVLRNVPLDQALERVASATGINLIYDSRLVQNVDVFCVERDAPPDELLRCVLDGTRLDYYQTSSGTYVLTESVRGAPAYGRFAGVVVDEDTGEPLPFANVLLADAGVGTAANEAGLFSFSTLKPGPYRIVVTYVGYEPKTDSVWIVPGGHFQERFGLNARSVSVEPIVVTGLQQRVPSQALGSDELTGDDIAAGLNNLGVADVARTTTSLLGVTLQEPSADIYLQGGAAGELQMQLDGIPVRSPVTLGQLLGAFSPLSIERMTVHKAGFGASHGSHLSGSIAAEHALSRADQQYLTAQFDPLSFNGRGQVFWKADGGAEVKAMLAGRTSLWSIFRDPTLSHLLRDWHVIDPLLTLPVHEAGPPSGYMDHQGDVAFHDVHAAVRVRMNPFHAFHASIYHGQNDVESEAIADNLERISQTDEGPLISRDSYHWTSKGGQLRYEGLITSRVLGTVSLYGSSQSLGHGYQMGGVNDTPYSMPASEWEGPYDGNWVNEIGLQAGVDVNVMRRHHVTGSIGLTRTGSRTLVDNDFFRLLDHTAAKWRIAGHIQDEISLGLRTNVEVGTRLTYIPDRQTLYAEPRLAVRYDGVHRSLGDYALRLAGGVYRQFVNEFDLSSTGPTALLPSIRFWLPVDSSHAPPRAYHLAADALLNSDGPWQINVEAYYKWQPHLLDINYPELLNAGGEGQGAISHADFVAPTRGRAFGGDVRVQYSTSAVTSTISYSHMRSLRHFPGRFEGREQSTPWEQPHRLSIKNSVGLTSTLTGHLNWRGIWGRSWAFRQAYYDYLVPQSELLGSIPVNFNNPSEQTLPPLYQLDMGVSYEYTWGDFTVIMRAEALNVLDRRNAFDLSLHESDSGFDQIARSLPGRRAAFSVRVSY